MKVLKDIIRQTKHKPNGGLKGELYDIVKNKNYDSNEVKQHFSGIGKLNQLHSVNRHLKESLLKSVLAMPLYGLNSSIRNKIKILRKELQARMLMYLGSGIAGTKVAIDTIVIAEKLQEFETIHRLCKELINQYSFSQVDTVKYKKYRLKIDEVERYIKDEMRAEKAYRDLRHHLNTKQSIDHFQKIINDLSNVTNSHFKFNFFRFSISNLYYQATNKHECLVTNNKAAYKFFDSIKIDIHYITKLNFIADIIPFYIFSREFAKAESAINVCLELPPKGSYNWHRILIYKVLLGFYSDKPKMSLNAFKTAHALKKRFKNKAITETWHLIKGYLVLMEKLGKLDKSELSESFRLRKYLNIEEQQRNDEQKANLLVLELLHLFVDKERKKYFEKQERVEGFLQNRFKAHRFQRTRYFLRLLKSIVRGNYHPVGVQAHAERQIKNLSKSKIDINVIDIEIMPYETLWSLVFALLGRKGKAR